MSSTSIKVASMTAAAISHGLMPLVTSAVWSGGSGGGGCGHSGRESFSESGAATPGRRRDLPYIDAAARDWLHLRGQGGLAGAGGPPGDRPGDEGYVGWRGGRLGYWRVRVPVPVSEPQGLLMVQEEMVMVEASGEVAPVAAMVEPVAGSV